MSDIYPITLERYNDWEKAGLTDENQIYQIYDTDEDIAKELIRTRKALEKAKKGLKELKDIIACPPDISYETGVSMYADGVLQEITALEQKD